MKSTQTNSIETIVSNRIKEILKLPDEQFSAPNSDLFSYFDSLSIMDLIVSLEDDFEIEIKPEDMTVEKFSSVKNISNFIKGEIGER